MLFVYKGRKPQYYVSFQVKDVELNDPKMRIFSSDPNNHCAHTA